MNNYITDLNKFISKMYLLGRLESPYTTISERWALIDYIKFQYTYQSSLIHTIQYILFNNNENIYFKDKGE